VTNNTARDLVNEVTETLVREARDREAAALQKALETAEENEAPATSLVSADVAADAEQVVNVAGELKQIATSEAANLLTSSDGNKAIRIILQKTQPLVFLTNLHFHLIFRFLNNHP
jgi:hypothetical protein